MRKIKPNIYINGNSCYVSCTIDGTHYNKSFKSLPEAEEYLHNIRFFSKRKVLNYPDNLIDLFFADDPDVDIVYVEEHFDKNFIDVLETLTPRENACIRLYFKEGYTLESIGNQLGITRERVRQIISKGLRRIQHPARLKYLRYGKELYDLQNSVLEMKEALQQKINIIAKRINMPSLRSIQVQAIELMPIDVLDLSVRSYHCLRRAGINTIGDLLSTSEDELRTIRHLGNKSVKEILTKLEPYRDTADFSEPYKEVPFYLDALSQFFRDEVKHRLKEVYNIDNPDDDLITTLVYLLCDRSEEIINASIIDEIIKKYL
jgi:RNA polymerase sigma factor (sigma-70 family)